MSDCSFYMGDTETHCYVHCSYKGLVTAKHCMDCRKDRKSNVNEMIKQTIENDIKRQLADLMKGENE